MWRLILHPNGPSLNELKTPGVWDLKQVYKFNALLDAEDDKRMAVEFHIRTAPHKKG